MRNSLGSFDKPQSLSVRSRGDVSEALGTLLVQGARLPGRSISDDEPTAVSFFLAPL